MANLTKSDRYDSIAVASGRIILYGPASPSAEYPSTSSTCSSAVVNPSTLSLSDVRRESCADPAVFGRSVIPAISIDKDLPSSSGGPSAVVRIAHVVAGSPGYALGPIVMTFSALAYGQSAPSWIYGDGDLWLYDWGNHFDLLRVSATTGAVLQRLKVPEIGQPLLAFNDEGLWIAPFGESTGPMYRLTPGATSASAVFDFTSGGFAKWLVASGDSVWLDAQPRPVSETSTVWELRGPDAVPVWHEAASDIIATVNEWQTGPSGMVGSGADGLWTVVVSASAFRQQVIRMGPSTGKLAVVATLAPRYQQMFGASSVLQSWTAATFDGSLFLLDPPAPVPGTENEVSGFSALYRIPPNGS
jgi:hypothetical protein